MDKILYCRCAYAQVVDQEVKDAVLRGLTESGRSFVMAPDLCEMAARRDPRLSDLVDSGGAGLKIAACYPRAVQWLLHSSGIELSEPVKESLQICNMRDSSSEQILSQLLEE